MQFGNALSIYIYIYDYVHIPNQYVLESWLICYHFCLIFVQMSLDNPFIK